MGKEELVKKYGASEQGNFVVVDSIGVPHPYCITPKHLLPDRMYLDAAAIRDAERTNGAKCDTCRLLVKGGKQPKVLSYDEHEQGLLVSCKKDMKEVVDGREVVCAELREFLLSVKELAVVDGFAGFAFKKDF